MAVDLQEIANNIIGGKKDPAVELTKQALSEGVSAQNIINEGMIAGMAVVGDRFKKNEFFVPEVLIAARAMKGCMEILKPAIAESGIQPFGKILIGTVKGDLHDIGKNLVAMMLEGNGFEVIDLGVDIPPQKFVSAAQEFNPDVLALSALLTTTMPAMKDTLEALQAAGLSKKVIIGGAPVTQNYCNEIGADGYAADAASAVDIAKSLISRN